MPGNKKAADTTKDKHGADFHARIAPLAIKSWVKNGRKPRGFAAMSPEQRKAAQLKSAQTRKKNRSDKGN